MDTRDIGAALSTPTPTETSRENTLTIASPPQEKPSQPAQSSEEINNIKNFLAETPASKPLPLPYQILPPEFVSSAKKNTDADEEKLAPHLKRESGFPAPSLEQLQLRVKAANYLQRVVKCLLPQLDMRVNDFNFNRQSEGYLWLRVNRFNFDTELEILDQLFKQATLDPTLVNQIRLLCHAAQQSIQYPRMQGSLPVATLIAWSSQIFQETEKFCILQDNEYMRLAKPQLNLQGIHLNTTPEGLSLDRDFYNKHFDFCVSALRALNNKNFTSLTALAVDYSLTLAAQKTENLNLIFITKEGLENAFRKQQFDDRYSSLGPIIFRNTLECIKNQDTDALVNYILGFQPSTAEEKDDGIRRSTQEQARSSSQNSLSGAAATHPPSSMDTQTNKRRFR